MSDNGELVEIVAGSQTVSCLDTGVFSEDLYAGKSWSLLRGGVTIFMRGRATPFNITPLWNDYRDMDNGHRVK